MPEDYRSSTEENKRLTSFQEKVINSIDFDLMFSLFEKRLIEKWSNH